MQRYFSENNPHRATGAVIMMFKIVEVFCVASLTFCVTIFMNNKFCFSETFNHSPYPCCIVCSFYCRESRVTLSVLTGHDCSIRLWNLDGKTCVQEITSHRKKCDEAIHDVAFHPSKPYIASAGADALTKVFV